MIERKKAFDFFSFFLCQSVDYQTNRNRSMLFDRICGFVCYQFVVQDQILFLPRITESLINNLHYSLHATLALIQRGNEHTRLYISCPCICLRGPQQAISTTKWKIDDGSTMDSPRVFLFGRRGKRFNNRQTNFRIDGSLR